MAGYDENRRKLFDFCASGDRIGLADHIISSGCNPSGYDIRNNLGKSALHIACEHGHLDTVRALIEIFGCNLITKDKSGNLPVHEACSNGHLSIIDYLLTVPKKEQGYLIDSILVADSERNNLLHKACQSGSVAVVRYLKQALCYPKSLVSRKLNLYHDSVVTYDSVSSDKVATCKNINFVRCVLAQNTFGDTPLHVACRHGHLDILKVFGTLLPFTGHLKSLAIIAAQCNFGDVTSYLTNLKNHPRSMLDIDSESIERKCVEESSKLQTFVKHHRPHYEYHAGSDDLVKCQKCNNIFPFNYVLLNDDLTGLCPVCTRSARVPIDGYRMRCTQCSRITNVESFAAKNACGLCGFDSFQFDLPVFAKSLTRPFKLPDFSKTPLHAAARCGNLKLYNNLQSTVSITDITLLHAACVSDNVELVTQIFKVLKCGVNCQDSNSNTSLHIACEWGSCKVVSLLTSFKDLQIDVLNTQQRSPLQLACLYNRFELCKFLIDTFKVCLVDPRTSNKETPLHLASCHDNYDLVQVICENCDIAAVINVVDEYGDSPIFNACRIGNLKLIKLLIEKGSNPLLVNEKTKDTPVHIACRMNRLDMLQVLLQGQSHTQSDNPAQRNSCGITPLQLAIENDNSKMVISLIDLGYCDVNEEINNHKSTVVHYACQRQLVDLVECLLQHSVNLDNQDKDGNTALHLSCLKNNCDIVKMLLDHSSATVQNSKLETPVHIVSRKGDVDLARCLLLGYTESLDSFADCNGNTPLHLACQKCVLDMISLLTKHCSSTVQNNNKETPLHIACKSNRVSFDVMKHLLAGCPKTLDAFVDINQNTVLHLAAEYACFEIVEQVLAYCSPTCINESGETPIHVACRRNCVKIIHLLLAKSSKVVYSNLGNSYLHSACAANLFQVVQYLVEESGLGIQLLQKKNDYGDTPLHIACSSGFTEIVHCLVGSPHCDPNTVNKDGFSPLHCALCSGHLDIFKKLLSSKIIDPKQCHYKTKPLLHCVLHLPNDIENSLHLAKFLVDGNYCDPSACDSDKNSVLHCAITLLKCSISKHSLLELWSFLLSIRSIDVNKQNKQGDTPLHLLCKLDRTTYARRKQLFTEMLTKLLSHKDIRTSLSTKNQDKKSPIQLANLTVIRQLISYGANPKDVYYEFQFILDKFKHQHPLDPAMKIIVVGNSTAGKSTLIQTIKKHSANYPILVPKVDGPTAGLETTEHSSKDFGRVTFHDFAGQPEYESGNSAFLENCFHSVSLAQPPIFLLLVDANKRSKLERNAKYWFTYIKNHSPQQLETPPHVIVVGSHGDCIAASEHSNTRKCIANAIDSIHSSKFEVFGPIVLDCRRMGSKQMKILNNILAKSCSSLRIRVDIDCRCHILFAYLSKWFKGKPAVKLSNVQEKIKSETEDTQRNVRSSDFYEDTYSDYSTYSYPSLYGSQKEDILLPFTKETLLELIGSLHSGGHVLLLNTSNECVTDCWIVMDNDSLFATVNGTLFAPEDFHLPKLQTNTGVVSEEKLHSLFQKIDIDLITEFAVFSEFCQRIEDPETLNLITGACSFETSGALDDDTEPPAASASSAVVASTPDLKDTSTVLNTSASTDSEPEKKETIQKYYFFPGLVKCDRPRNVWDEDSTYTFGWYLVCNRNHFLDPRFLHVLLLRLTFNFATESKSLSEKGLVRKCNIWKNGIHWSTRSGVEILVEVVEQNTAVLLLVRFIREFETEGIKVRSQVIKKILDTKEEFCPHAKMAEYILPQSLSSGYPDITNLENIIHISEIAQAISGGEPCVLDSKHKPHPLKAVLHYDPYLQIGQKNIESLWSEDISDEEVDSKFFWELSRLQFTFLHQVTQVLDVPQTDVDVHKEQWEKNPINLLLHIFESWKVRQSIASYQTLREVFDSHSIFCGRNPLELSSSEVPQIEQDFQDERGASDTSSQTGEHVGNVKELKMFPKGSTQGYVVKGVGQATASYYQDPLLDPILNEPTMAHLTKILWVPDLSREPSKLCIVKDAAHAWKTIAETLHIDSSVTDMIRYPQKPAQQCMGDLFRWWLNNSSELPGADPTWKGLHDVLVNSNLKKLADDLQRALANPYNSVRGNLQSPAKASNRRHRSSTPRRKRRTSGGYGSQD